MSEPSQKTVRILDEDRNLGSALRPEDLSIARRFAIADVFELRRGTHRPNDVSDGSGLLGLLVLDGLMIRQVGIGRRRCGEIVGPGALVRPWDDLARSSPLPFEIVWRVIRPVRLAVLDRRFHAAIVRWPALLESFVERAAERAHTLALGLAVHCRQRVEERLLLLFWHLADRFGRVTPAGTVLPMSLSHADLAELVGAARPSVSTALKELTERGLVRRNRDDRSWLLGIEPPWDLVDLHPDAALDKP